MGGRRLALFLLLYVALDFSNPHMPGAVNFDPADSVEGVHAERVRADRQEAASETPAALFPVAAVEHDRPPRPPVNAAPLTDREPPVVRRSPTRSPDPASPGDDH